MCRIALYCEGVCVELQGSKFHVGRGICLIVAVPNCEYNDLDRRMVLDITLWRKLIHKADPP